MREKHLSPDKKDRPRRSGPFQASIQLSASVGAFRAEAVPLNEARHDGQILQSPTGNHRCHPIDQRFDVRIHDVV